MNYLPQVSNDDEREPYGCYGDSVSALEQLASILVSAGHHFDHPDIASVEIDELHQRVCERLHQPRLWAQLMGWFNEVKDAKAEECFRDAVVACRERAQPHAGRGLHGAVAFEEPPGTGVVRDSERNSGPHRAAVRATRRPAIARRASPGLAYSR